MLTTLPFQGFYNTMFGAGLEDAERSCIEYEAERDEILDESEISEIVDKCRDYGAQMLHVAQEYVDYFNVKFNEEFGINPKLRFESMTSPREYNFSTDRIFAYIDEEVAKELLNRIGEPELDEAIRERFTSRDGFISFYSNRIETWRERPLEEWDFNEVGTILAAYVDQVDDFEWDIFGLMQDVFYWAFEKGMDWDKFREMCDERREEIEEELAAEALGETPLDAEPDHRFYPEGPLDLVQYVTDFCRMNHLKD